MKPIPGALTLATAALTAVPLLASCGGSEGGGDTGAAQRPSTAAPAGTPTTTPPSPKTPVPRAKSSTPTAVKSLKACMRRHGVEVPADGVQWSPPPGYDPRKAQAAFKACMKRATPPASP